MRFFLLLIATILMASIACAEVTITGPEKTKVGQVIQLNVTGVTFLDVTGKPEAKPPQLPKILIRCYPQADMCAGAWFFGTGAGVFFQSSTPGEYCVTVPNVVDGPLKVVEHKIVVGSGGPGPEPLPPEPLPNDTKYQVTIVFEQRDMNDGKYNRQQVALLKGDVLRDGLAQAGHVVLGVVDKNVVAKSEYGKLMIPFIKKAKDLPCVVIAPLTGGEFKTFTLPNTMAETISQVSRGG
jgi:hypothetical protein